MTNSPVSINALVAEFAVMDWRKSVAFYQDLLGFALLYDRPEEGFVFLQRGGAQLMLYQANLGRNLVSDDLPLVPPLGRGMNLQIQVEAIAPILQALQGANVELALAPERMLYRVGDRHLEVHQFAVSDPDGYYLRFSQQVGFQPPDTDHIEISRRP